MPVSPAASYDETTQPSAASALIRSAYEAFAAGDVPAVLETFAEDISWHIPGRSPVAGVYVGHDRVLDFFGRLGELSNGTFSLGLHAFLDDGAGRVAVLTTERAERNGTHAEFDAVHYWSVENGKATRFQAYMADEYGVDAFWSS
jgi:ketosteroid isomerase-like protein